MPSTNGLLTCNYMHSPKQWLNLCYYWCGLNVTDVGTECLLYNGICISSEHTYL